MTTLHEITPDARQIGVLSLAYQVGDGFPQEKQLKELMLDDVIHVLTGLQARQRDGSPSRLATTQTLNDLRAAHFTTAEQDVRAAVTSVLGARRLLIGSETLDDLVGEIMHKVGSIRSDWAVELYDTHVRLHSAIRQIDALRTLLKNAQAAQKDEQAVAAAGPVEETASS